MRLNTILLAALAAAQLVGLAGCVVPDDGYGRHAAYEPYRGSPPARWDYDRQTWRPSRWDSGWDDRYRRQYYRDDRP